MRFNDLFATILSGPAESDWSRALLWRQCVDLLAQYGMAGSTEKAELDRVADTMASLSDRVTTDQKLAVLRDLGGRLRSPRLVRLLLREDAQVQAAAMRHARLPDSEWPSIIAQAGPLARSVLRQRPDLAAEARRALDAFGLSDLSLIDLNADTRDELVLAPAAILPAVEESLPEQSQIRRIVDRIERFTSERQDRVQREPENRGPEPVSEPVMAFTFLADVGGVILSAHGVPPTQLAGLRLATPSIDRSVGPDGQILGAFRRRGAFREGRLTIGDGALAGCWLVDGDPLFDPRTGRFTGYRGAARRASERDLAPQSTPAETQEEATSHSTSMRQLIHELRSPLSGVMGFAELIETQLLGPVSDGYRSMAGDIVGDVRILVDILDDLDLANRTDRLTMAAGEGGSDAARLLRDAVERLGRDADGRMRISPDIAAGLPPVNVSPLIAERMISHFVRAMTGCVGTESLSARATRSDSRLAIEIDRPDAMAGLTDEQLFDSGFEHIAINSDAPILGIGFALRLVRRLAQENKGAFTVHPDHLTLSLPLHADIKGHEASN